MRKPGFKIKRMVIVLGIFVLATGWVEADWLGAEERQIHRRANKDSDGLRTERRVALVIGNGAYGSSPLPNPVNDARVMAKALKEMGFEVTEKENLNWQDMNEAVGAFGNKLLKGGVGLFYFAGHGIQIEGRNYLIPVGAEIDHEKQVKFKAVDAGVVLAEMENARNRLNIVILDACRNNPFARSFRSSAQGLASMDAPTGTIVAYATAPGKTASDNGLYTAKLIQEMRTPGSRLEDVFSRVRKAVRTETDGRQVPWESTSLEGTFYFRYPDGGGDPPVRTGSLRVETNPAGASVEVEGSGGARKGTTPASFPELTPGKVKVRVSFEGYESKVLDVEIKAGSEASQRITLDRKTPKVGDSLTDLVTGMELKWVPKGCYQMGCGPWTSECSVDEKPVHEVCVDGFWMGKTEVTQGQWKAVMGKDNNPSGFNKGDAYPVEQVSWEDAREYIEKLNGRSEGGGKYRLPSEAEWEYAARSGGKEEKHAGGNDADAVAWYEKNSGKSTHPVGKKQANGLGPI